MGMNQSRDEILIEEKNMKDDDDDTTLVQVLNCYAGNRVVEFEFPRTLCLSADNTVLDMKRRLDISSSDDEGKIVVMCDEVDGSKSRSVKDKIVLKDSDILLSSIPKKEDEVFTLPIIYIQYMSRKKEEVTTKNYSPLNDGIKIK